MFNLENFELDFEDDFSTNLFSEKPKTENTIIVDKERNKEIKVNNVEELPAAKVETLKRQVDLNEITNSQSQSKKLKNDLQTVEFLQCTLNNSHKVISNFVKGSTRTSATDKFVKKKWTSESLVQRKFPGPAGLLPDKPFRGVEDISIPEDELFDKENEEKSKNQQIIYSQSSASLFLESAYQKLVYDFDLNEVKNPLHKYSIEWIKKTALNKALNGRKVPFLCVVLHSINHDTPDPVLLLKDPTGEIHGTLHREVWADLGSKLQAGIALALRQVGVLITGVIRRQIHLNITINNILAIYGLGENGEEVEVTTVNKVSKADLLKSLQEWKVQKSGSVPSSPVPNTIRNSLFTTISLTPKEEINNLRNELQCCIDFRPKNINCKESALVTNKKEEIQMQPFADSGIEFAEVDFFDELIVPQNESVHKKSTEIVISKAKENPKISAEERRNQTLSQADSLILDEVLSGIDLNEFET